MSDDPEIARILREHLHDPSSSFSVGSYGAIAEFHRDIDEPLAIDESEALIVATKRGALRIEMTSDVKPRAYETLSKRPDRWQHGVVFCLPEARAEGHRRTMLTELGLDGGAIRPVDRGAVLFDMGLGARNVDFCIRTRDPALLSVLRQGVGRSALEPDSPIMAAIVDASPHRVALSGLARAEVYQNIGKEKTPEGPHTHVLPELLKTGWTHSANIPVPRGFLPCLSLYPANPLYHSDGRSRAFDQACLTAFAKLIDDWGAPEYRAEKRRALALFQDDIKPGDYTPPRTRLGRTALRVALRQLRQSDIANPTVVEWSLRFDTPRSQAAEPSQST